MPVGEIYVYITETLIGMMFVKYWGTAADDGVRSNRYEHSRYVAKG